MTQGFDAVSLDVGGVLVVPDHAVLAEALLRQDVPFDRSRFGVGHYLAMAAVDAAASRSEDFTDYLDGVVAAIAVPTADRPRAHAALAAVLATPVWRQPVDGAREGVRALADAGVRLGVTSNSDGTIAEHLLRLEWLQVGEGPGALVEVITDSGIVGVGKPDPAMYDATVAALALPPSRILHVGDSVHYDVDGAAACGLQSIHMDPYGVCTSTTHAHLSRLTDLLGV
jgi:putative hydrolase of the HAD superfamily